MREAIDYFLIGLLTAIFAANVLFALWLLAGMPFRCGRCERFHLIRWSTMKSSLCNGRRCPHCKSGKIFQ